MLSGEMEFSPPLHEQLHFAEELAKAARAETLARFRRPLAIENKAAAGRFDPVTAADRAAEAAMRALITARFPDHGIIGEEAAAVPARSPFSWVLDPIDGTRAYVCGLPSWGTLIALTENGRPILGLIDLPAVGQLYRGWPGGADVEEAGLRRALRLGHDVRLDQAALATTDPGLFTAREGAAFAEVQKRARFCRYGLDCSGYAALAAGGLDLVIESGLQIYDIAAIIPVIQGAGGQISAWNSSQDFHFDAHCGQIVAAANAQLLAEALALLAPAALPAPTHIAASGADGA